MDTESTKDFWWFWAEFWPSMAVAIAIYGGGLTATRVGLSFVPAAKDYLDGKTQHVDLTWPLLFRLWATTRVAHPFIVGAAISFVPGLPRPDFITSQTSAALWFGFVGMMNGQVHLLGDAFWRQMAKLISLIVPWVRKRINLPSEPPPPPDPAELEASTTDPEAERQATETEVAEKIERR